jgi:hypothetical protein
LPPSLVPMESLNSNNRAWRSPDRPQNIRVGKYFMLSDFLYSETAVIKGISNCPPLAGREVESIKGLCAAILDPVVERFGAISITFGYVSPELQRAIPGRMRPSVHNICPAGKAVLGAAADFQAHNTEYSHKDILLWIAGSCTYDRLILYPGSTIVCVAWSDKPRSHCKQWIYPDQFSKAIYIDLPQEPNQRSLFEI